MDINVLLNKGEKKLETQVKRFTTTLGETGKDIIQTGLKVISCMKQCFMEKNSDGYCFDKAGCQPLINASSAGKTIKTCIKHIGWKREATDICNCMVKSGLKDMEQYCQLLNTISGHKKF